MNGNRKGKQCILLILYRSRNGEKNSRLTVDQVSSLTVLEIVALLVLPSCNSNRCCGRGDADISR